jgi:uncharacterized repeat protein (TIGR03803 family)
MQGSDGYFYGTTLEGGTNGQGTVFKISTNGVLATLCSFSGTNDGAGPNGLLQGSDGYFYGTTLEGGTNGQGTVFKISTNGVLATLCSFSGTNDGAGPNGLLQGSDGNFYGTTTEGGTSGGDGTVFKISANGALSSLYSFPSGNDGAYPDAALVQGSDGSFYGTTGGGGTNNQGAVFKISTDGALTNLYSFPTENDGAGPSGLVQASDGSFYGTTLEGGTNNQGTVFKITTNGVLTSLYSFTGTDDGANPHAALVQGSDGNFYGTTTEGGITNYDAANETYGYGTVFQISTNGVLTSLYSFTGGNDGAYPEAALVQGSDGSLYGTTELGGAAYTSQYRKGLGTVFKISTHGGLKTLYAFTVTNANGYPLDGAFPSGVLVQGSDGNFYGTTGSGSIVFGFSGFGTVFKMSASGALTSLYSFTNGIDGADPAAGLVQGSDGYLYGTTLVGGTINSGTIFKISTQGALTTLYAFGTVTNANGYPLDGAEPYSGLVQGSDGSFYGTTSSGGAGGVGTVFRLTIVPEFQAVTLTNNMLSLAWSTEAGGTYQLQCNSDLSSSNWINLSSPVTATGATLSTTDSLTNSPQRFYRLVLSP